MNLPVALRLLALPVAAAAAAGCSGGGTAAARAVAPVPVVTGTVETRDVPVEVVAIGNAEAVESVAIQPRVGGEIVGVHFAEGTEVARGQLLFTIDPRPYRVALEQAEARLARDAALLRKAEEDVRRYERLVKQEYVTREQYDNAVAQAEALRATIRGNDADVERARLELEYASIRAPISGRAGRVLVERGNLVKDNDDRTLVTILSTRPIEVAFAVPERHLAEIRARHAEGRLEVSARPRDGRGDAAIGRVVLVDNAVDRASGTIRLKARFENADGALWPGQYLEVALRLESLKGAIVVPRTAVQTGQSGTYVFVVRPDGTAETRAVEVAFTRDDVTIVRGALAAGETVITDGQLRVVPGARVEAKPAAGKSS
ncbi:MAG TPA: efflux RND transporter periplasmic adaptor subunit [Candidatus Polarisedimenticolaceae bacterium]